MRTKNPIVQGLIDYLNQKLCHNLRGIHRFTKVGPRCFFFEDAIDTIFVKITDKNMVILTDGDGVRDQEISVMIPTDNGSDLNPDELYNNSLQTILAFF